MKEKLFISSATKNNWDKLNLSEEEKLSKLSKRANKQNSQKILSLLSILKINAT